MRHIRHSVLILLILIQVIGNASAYGYSDEEIEDNPYVQERIADFPATDPEILKSIEKRPDVAAVFGEIPELNAGKESFDFFVRLKNVHEKIVDEKALEGYLFPEGPVHSYRVAADNYLIIDLCRDGKKVSDETIDGINEIINRYAENESVGNIPIVYEYVDVFAFYYYEPIINFEDKPAEISEYDRIQYDA